MLLRVREFVTWLICGVAYRENHTLLWADGFDIVELMESGVWLLFQLEIGHKSENILLHDMQYSVDF